MKFKISILDFGVNNIKSLVSFFNLFGKVNLVDDYKNFNNDSEVLIIPGNGSFGQGIDTLKKKNFKKIILDTQRKKKIIGICLGMQVFFESSEENKGTNGLGIIKGSVSKIKSSEYKTPLLGWYDINFLNNDMKRASFYFNNGFSVVPDDKTIIKGAIIHDNNKSIVAIVKKNNIYGLQFHPEKSSHNGNLLISKILSNEL